VTTLARDLLSSCPSLRHVPAAPSSSRTAPSIEHAAPLASEQAVLAAAYLDAEAIKAVRDIHTVYGPPARSRRAAPFDDAVQRALEVLEPHNADARGRLLNALVRGLHSLTDTDAELR
jgi:hypothetical protein